jgi:hypothetical protein
MKIPPDLIPPYYRDSPSTPELDAVIDHLYTTYTAKQIAYSIIQWRYHQGLITTCKPNITEQGETLCPQKVKASSNKGKLAS